MVAASVSATDSTVASVFSSEVTVTFIPAYTSAATSAASTTTADTTSAILPGVIFFFSSALSLPQAGQTVVPSGSSA